MLLKKDMAKKLFKLETKVKELNEHKNEYHRTAEKMAKAEQTVRELQDAYEKQVENGDIQIRMIRKLTGELADLRWLVTEARHGSES